MGKKGKNKNQTITIENQPPKVESEKIEEKKEIKPEVPAVVNVEPKIEEVKAQPVKEDNSEGENDNESKEGTLKSKKRRNRKKKNTATEFKIEETAQEKPENVNKKEEPKSEPQPAVESNEKAANESSTDTLKKKRRRNKKKNVGNVGDAQENEDKEEIPENEKSNEVVVEKSVEDNATSQQNTLKKNKRNNKNKNNNKVEAQNEEKPVEPEASQKVETKPEQKEKQEPQRRGKKQKRFDLSSKKTISDELQERQEREQEKARDHIKNEIAKREKLLETIDLVLDCHKTEAELAKSQQESIKDVKKLSTEAAQAMPQPSSSKSQKQPKKPVAGEEELVNKIEQVLGMTKLEIKNAQSQKAYVNRLEVELAKVKQSKDILLGKEPVSLVPEHIKQKANELCDLSKDIPKTKEELVKEIESRDVLMSEINRVLDSTKTEIEKVQKQQKIIQNLEVELHKMKEQEIVEKLMILEEEVEEEPAAEPEPPKQSAGTASLLDALMANVGKLKEMQAMKEKQKAEQVSKPQEKVEPKLESKVEEKSQDALTSVVQPPQQKEKSKSPPKDAKKPTDDKKQPSPKASPEQNKKQQKDQKQKQPQKKQESKPLEEDKKVTEEEAVPKTESKVENVLKESAPIKIEKEIKTPVEEKKVEAPKQETKNVEAPKQETKNVEAPKQEIKNVEAPKQETKNVEAPKLEEKKTEVPKNNEKKIEPKKEKQQEVPKQDKQLETPKIESPKLEKKSDLPKSEEKKSESPKTEQKKIEVPKNNEKKQEPSKDKKPESPKKENNKKDQKHKNVEQTKPQEQKIEVLEQEVTKTEKVAEPIKEEVKKSEENKVEAPKPQEKKVEQPKVAETKIEKPKVAELKVEPEKIAQTKVEEKKPAVTPKPQTPKPEKKKLEQTVEKSVEEKKAPQIPEVPEVKPITSSEPTVEKDSPKLNDQKKNDKGNKGSPKHKNKHHKNEKNTSAGVPEFIPPPPITPQKPSMAEMLKNAPDPPPEEIEKEIKEELPAPLARPESAIIEVKPSEVIKEQAQPKEKEESKLIEEPLKVDEKIEQVPKSPAESDVKSDDGLVIVDKAEIEKEMKKEQNEMESTDPKNAQGGGFVSPANDIKNEQDKDAKPLRKDGKQQENKPRSPVKAPSKGTQKPAISAKLPQNKPAAPKPKLDVQAKVNSRPTDAKKTSPQSTSPKKPSSPSTEKSELKFESAPVEPSSPKIDNTITTITPQDNSVSPSTEKPKIPPRPDVTKTSNTKPAPKAGNVTNPLSVKPKTPSPIKPSPSSVVTKPATTSTAQTQSQTAKPKPTVSQAKSANNTKNTNQKPLATQQKANSTKTSTAPKQPSSTATTTTCDSVFRLRQLRSNNNNKNNKKSFSLPAFRIRMDEKSMCPIKRPLTSPNPNDTNQMKAILTQDGSIKIILPSTIVTCGHLQKKFLLKDITSITTSSEVSSQPKTATTTTSECSSQAKISRKNTENDESDEDDQYSEYKMTPRQIFCASICQVCKVNLSRYFLCIECKMVAYCKEEHMKIDYLNHKGLCMAIQLIAKRRGGHVYNMSKHLTNMEYRNLRLHTIYLCEQFMNRTLLTFEKEIFLFPRLCHDVTCREWKSNLLNDCEKCGLVSFCALHPISENHKRTCSSFALFQRIILHEKSYGRIDVALPQKVLRKIPILTDNLQDTMRLLYKNITAFQDECVNAALMQIATAPLTTFYSYQKVGLEFKEQMTIHFVGAELKFEGDRLEKWESLFLHLAHNVSDLQIIFIGAELNHENLPVEIISRTRMCKTCRQDCCGVKFDFQCKKFYHDYCESSAYVKPDFVCFFNPALHRPGFRGFDTWPKTIEAALKTEAPILVTSTTENECYLDLKRIKKITNDDVEILVPPLKNPYAATRPERNFASDDEDLILFKNNYFFVVGKTQDLIEL